MRWGAYEDLGQGEWVREIKLGAAGDGTRAEFLRKWLEEVKVQGKTQSVGTVADAKGKNQKGGLTGGEFCHCLSPPYRSY